MRKPGARIRVSQTRCSTSSGERSGRKRPGSVRATTSGRRSQCSARKMAGSTGPSVRTSASASAAGAPAPSGGAGASDPAGATGAPAPARSGGAAVVARVVTRVAHVARVVAGVADVRGVAGVVTGVSGVVARVVSGGDGRGRAEWTRLDLLVGQRGLPAGGFGGALQLVHRSLLGRVSRVGAGFHTYARNRGPLPSWRGRRSRPVPRHVPVRRHRRIHRAHRGTRRRGGGRARCDLPNSRE